eukprot:3603194-Pyramimonas_sp.AAC.1
MEGELEEEEKQSANLEVKQSNRRFQEEMQSALGQLNQRLERLEGRPRAPSTADGSILPVGSSQDGPGGV